MKRSRVKDDHVAPDKQEQFDPESALQGAKDNLDFILSMQKKMEELKLENSRLKKDKEGKKRNYTEKGIWRKAKMLYYSDKKNDEKIISQVTEKLKKGNLLKTKTVVGEDQQTTEVPVLPVGVLKQEIDEIFDQLPDDDKKIYYKWAEDILVKSQKNV